MSDGRVPTTTTTGEGARSRAAGALASGLDILETLAGSAEGMGVTAIARAAGQDKGNAHRLLRMLEERGYVEQDPHTKAYRASVQLVSLAGQLLRGLDVVTTAQRTMRELSSQTGEAVHLARRTKSGAVYVAQERQGGGIVTVETEIGAQPVIHATATGKALYCLAAGEELERVVRQPLRSFTIRTITSMDALAADLERVRERGYAVDDEELNLDVRCVAAPVFDMYGTPVASIGLSGPAARVGLSRVDELGKQVLAAAVRITEEMGGHVPVTFGAHPTPPPEVQG
ncbi:IclR family transcriptional regulator [Actinomadura nitritigenes]|uniref:IclR family transcriptional regulator n=1 Tax=Actinomadura nitritigenes TaxID=134602 RepID=A0ABS3RFF3_9ACTN|nr:IclR family transcriptional regulator [Actinomadura nitritigenes]MBO2444308.1 IclR family transcriptional regulator [Actinomadura nitritigenes]